MTGITWERSVVLWAGFMTASACTPTTIEQRTYHVARVGRALGGRPGDVTTAALVDWLSERDWKPNTRRAYRGSLRAFFGWLVAAGHLERSPAAALPTVKVPRPVPRPTPETAYRLALRIADKRARMATLLAGVCGLRRGEVARARREDVAEDLVGWSLRVLGKGGKERLVPLPDELARMLLAQPAGWLFPSPAGGHLTPHHLGKMVSANLPAGFTMHTLRHRCATVAYAQTQDLRAVQELLGHAKPETTAIYTAVPGGAIRAAVAAAS